MATITERFGFTKPAGSDPASVVPLNSNTDLIELYLGRTQDSIAPMYDDTETYSVGDLRTYESRLYKCNTDISTPETFDPEKWDLTTAVQEGGGSGGASAIEKTQAEYNALTPAQKTNGAIYMVQSESGEEKDLTERMSGYTSSSGTVSAYNSKNANFLAWHALASENSFDASVNGEYWAGNGDGAYLQFDFTTPVMISKIGFASYRASNFKIMYSTDGNEYIYAQNVTREAQSGYICTKTDTILDSEIRDCVSIRLICDGAEYNVGALHFYGYDSVESVNKIYYMGTEYANTNGGSGGGGSSEAKDINYDNTTSQLTADNVQDALDEVVANVGTASKDILTLQNVQGYDKYDETQTYAVGDYAIYNNIVYECTTAVSTAEPFDSAKWTATSIKQIIDGVKGDVSQLNSSIGDWKNITFSGTYSGELDGVYNNKLKLAIVSYNSKTANAEYTATMNVTAKKEQFGAIRGGGYLQVRGTSSTISINNSAQWSVGQIIFTIL